jgi:serine/threonine-protein kinase RsbW
LAKGYGAAKQQYGGRGDRPRALTAEHVYEVGLGAKGRLRAGIMEYTADLEAGGAQARRVRLTMPAKAEYVALSRLTIAALGSRAGLEPEVVADLKVAVTEACSLLVAPPEAAAGTWDSDAAILIEFDLSDDAWTIKVVGDRPFSGDSSETCLDVETAGLGLTIIGALVDSADCGSCDGGWFLRMVKRLP